MNYIILSNGENNSVFICRLSNDGTYVKIAQVFKGEDASSLIAKANAYDSLENR